MKRLLSAVLAAAMVFSLAACGGTGTVTGEAPSSAAADIPAADDTAPGETAVEDEAASGAVPDEGPAYGATLEEQLVLDDAEHGVKITATGMRMGTAPGQKWLLYRSGDGFETARVPEEQKNLYVDFTVENSSDKNYRIVLSNLLVDGCGVGDTYLKKDSAEGDAPDIIAAGETATASVSLASSYLAEYDIETISDISFNVYLYTMEEGSSYPSDLAISPTCTLTTSAYGEYTYTFAPEGEVLYDEGGVTVTLGPCTFRPSSFESQLRNGDYGFAPYDVSLYISNQSEEELLVSNEYNNNNNNGSIVGDLYTRYTNYIAPGTYSIGTLRMMPASADISTSALTDETVDTYEFATGLALYVGGHTYEDPTATLDIKLSFDDSEAKAYYDALPTSEEEAIARYENKG